MRTESFLSGRDLISRPRTVQIIWKTLLRFKSYLIFPKGVEGGLVASIPGMGPGALGPRVRPSRLPVDSPVWSAGLTHGLRKAPRGTLGVRKSWPVGS